MFEERDEASRRIESEERSVAEQEDKIRSVAAGVWVAMVRKAQAAQELCDGLRSPRFGGMARA
eukprot:962971-Lingulodinium_polyedra.AAC.1